MKNLTRSSTFLDLGFNNFNLIEQYAKKVNLINKDGRFVLQTAGLIKRELTEIHLVIPMVHGAGTEDGSIQGYLNMVGIPYVGSNVYSSAVSQDKAFVKMILKANDINTTNFVWFGERFYRNKKIDLFKQIDDLKYPLIIKPASLGSSVGIEMISRKEELDSTIERVFKYDSKVIIEEKIEDLIEYNVSVLLTSNGNITSEIEEVKDNLTLELVKRYYGLRLARDVIEVRKQIAEGISKHYEDAILLDNGKHAIISKSNRDKGQREFCGCMKSKDIGEYNTCPHLCEYCYANTSKEIAITNYKQHKKNPLSDTITGK